MKAAIRLPHLLADRAALRRAAERLWFTVLAVAAVMMLATSGGLAQAAALANDTAVPVALVRGEEGGASLNVLPIPVAQVEAQVLEITRLHTQRALAGSVADAAAEAASDVGAPWTEVAGEPVTRRIQRVEVALGGADPRLKLAPCEKVQTYVPEGSRLWGKSRVGLRCEQGAVRWNVFVPVTVRVWGLSLIHI